MQAPPAVRRQPPVGRLLRRVGSVMFWSLLLVLGAFGTYFSFANYPAFGVGVLLVVLLLTVSMERQRRARRRASDARRRARARRSGSG